MHFDDEAAFRKRALSDVGGAVVDADGSAFDVASKNADVGEALGKSRDQLTAVLSFFV